MNWTRMSDKDPPEGYTGLILVAPVTDPGSWFVEPASFCDGMWYQLTYDSYTGVLRKMPVHEKVIAYNKYLIPDWSYLA